MSHAPPRQSRERTLTPTYRPPLDIEPFFIEPFFIETNSDSSHGDLLRRVVGRPRASSFASWVEAPEATKGANRCPMFT